MGGQERTSGRHPLFNTNVRPLVLLPGLDGTGRLFERFRSLAPPEVRVDVVSLPTHLYGYRALIEFLVHHLDLRPDSVLLAESFSGPLALGVAAQRPVAGIILCNSFIQPPAPPLLRSLIHPALFRMAPPPWVVRRYLVGRAAPEELVAQVRDLIASLAPELIAGRLATILGVNAVDNLHKFKGPLLYLRGSNDLLVPDSAGQALLDAAGTQVRMERIAGPHLLLQTAPEAAWQAIMGFMSALPA
jgi:pimeloyl-ACP methyl ester carboxylesterase